MKTKAGSTRAAHATQPGGVAVTPPLPLPHERDESAEAPGPARRVVKQAEKDLNAGMVDTDNYTRAKLVSEGAALPPVGAAKRSRNTPGGS